MVKKLILKESTKGLVKTKVKQFLKQLGRDIKGSWEIFSGKSNKFLGRVAGEHAAKAKAIKDRMPKAKELIAKEYKNYPSNHPLRQEGRATIRRIRGQQHRFESLATEARIKQGIAKKLKWIWRGGAAAATVPFFVVPKKKKKSNT